MGENLHDSCNGLIGSLSVLRTYRRLGIAASLIEQSGSSVQVPLLNLAVRAMKECYNAEKVELHVRETNRVALRLYRTLGFVYLDK